jgi:hypothetical protein
MTEDMEKKLNELLGLKKQLEELTSAKEKSNVTSVFEEKLRKTNLYFYIWFAVSFGITLYGIAGLFMNTGKYQIISLFWAVLGFEGTILMKLWYHTTTTKLSILQEMKQMELRITELLQKK